MKRFTPTTIHGSLSLWKLSSGYFAIINQIFLTRFSNAHNTLNARAQTAIELTHCILTFLSSVLSERSENLGHEKRKKSAKNDFFNMVSLPGSWISLISLLEICQDHSKPIMSSINGHTAFEGQVIVGVFGWNFWRLIRES